MKIRTIVTLSIAFLVGVSLMSPQLALARNGGEDKDEWRERKAELKELKREMREERKELQREFKNLRKSMLSERPLWNCLRESKGLWDDSCWPGFNHFWWWRGVATSTATSTPDTIAPVVSATSTRVVLHSARISWKTNELSESAVLISTSSPVNITSSSTREVMVPGRRIKHSVMANQLTASTTYYVLIRAKDRAGNIGYSPEFSFTTLSSTTTATTTNGI